MFFLKMPLNKGWHNPRHGLLVPLLHGQRNWSYTTSNRSSCSQHSNKSPSRCFSGVMRDLSMKELPKEKYVYLHIYTYICTYISLICKTKESPNGELVDENWWILTSDLPWIWVLLVLRQLLFVLVYCHHRFNKSPQLERPIFSGSLVFLYWC